MREEDRLADILFEWRERKGRGELVDPEVVIREHPDLAERLRSWFLALAAVDEVLSESPVLREGVPDRVAGYRLTRELGAGGMGTVYLAVAEEERYEVPEGAEVALKLLHPHLLANPGVLARFRREAEAGRAVRHENVLRTLDVGVEVSDGLELHYLVLEYVEGRTLRELQKDLVTVPEALLREIAAQVAAGVSAIHEAGLVHRDLKPENLIITGDRRVRIMDLGIARLIDATLELTRDGQFAGSLLYAAPEQVAEQPVGPAADLYSLGVTLYELATGENPFRRPSVPAIVHAQLHHKPPRAGELSGELSPFLAELIASLLEKEPERRLGSADELSRILAAGERSAWWVERERDLREAKSRRPRIPVRRETELAGREEELAALHAAWAAAGRGDGSTLLIEGEAGIGKTRLIDEFLRGLEDEDVNVLYGSYSPFGGRGALSEAVIGRFGETSLARSLSDMLPAASFVPAFSANLLSESLPEGVERLEGDAIHTVFRQIARALAEERPTIWVVEDLHFAPADSRRVARSLSREVAGRRALLILTTRTGLPADELALFGRMEGCRRMALSRLSPREVIGLLRDALKSRELADKLGAKIAYQSDGVPFFIFEMIRGLEEGQFITEQPDGSFAETKVVERIETPAAVRELVSARLLGLSRLERSIMDVGAVEGFEFDPDVVARVRGMKRFEVLECLAHLERRSGVVRGAEGVCRFDHHQIQEVLYQDLPPDLRAEYHALIADAIADRERSRDGGRVPGEIACRLAVHSLKGSRPEAGVPHLVPAIEHLTAELRQGEALDLAERALADEGLLAGPERARVLLLRAAVLTTQGRREEERESLAQALSLIEDGGDGSLAAAVQWRLADWLVRNGSASEARDRAARAASAARSAGDREEEAAAVRALGIACRASGRLEEALEQDERAVALAAEIGDASGEAGATVEAGIVLTELGRREEARSRLTRGLALARRLGDRRGEANAALALRRLLRDRGGFEDAGRQHEEDLALCRRIGYRWGEALANGNLGGLHLRFGRYARAAEHYRRALAIDRELGRRSGEGWDSARLGEVLLLLGRTTEAGELAQRAVWCARETSSPLLEGRAIQLLGRVALAEGRLPDARGRFEPNLALMRGIPHPPGTAAALLALGEVAALEGHEEEAAASFSEAGELARDLDLPGVAVLAAARRSLSGRGREAARAVFERAKDRLGHAERLEAAYLLGDLEAARRLLDELVASAPRECREGLVESLPLYRAITASGA